MKDLRITRLCTYCLTYYCYYRAVPCSTVYSLFNTLPMPGLYSQCVANIRVVLCSTFLLDQVYVIPRPCNFTSGMHKFIYLFIHIFKVTDCKSIYSVACIRLDVLLNLHSSSKEFAQSAQHTIIQSANSIFD
jgi:hypothetical protein